MALTDKLTAIADGFRTSRGTTDKYTLEQMAVLAGETVGSDPVIESLEITSNGTYTATDCDGYSPITVNVPQDGAPTDAELIVKGTCNNRFANNGWNWVIDKYGNRITTENITNCERMFQDSSQLDEIPFTINIKNVSLFTSMFNNCTELETSPKIRGTIYLSTSATFTDMFSRCYRIRDFEELFTPEMLDGFSSVKVTNAYSTPRTNSFYYCYSLRRAPSWWYKFRLNEESTAFPSYNYTIYYQAFYYCYSLDEVLDIPVWKCAAAQTSNMFTNTFGYCRRAKNITFETNDDGTAKTANWKSQTIDLTGVGYLATNTEESYILNYNSGITADKRVGNPEQYEALKNDPDWYAHNTSTSGYGKAYSRYNKISALNTINSLPDTSEYLATAGGTNTIKFTGTAGSLTDGGAINTLTEEEIAVATAKGWTVTFA